VKFSDDYRPRAARRVPADLDWSDVWADAARMREEQDADEAPASSSCRNDDDPARDPR
jgi:hypothetical protein